MSSQYLAAIRAKFEPELVCPQCGEENSPKEPRAIRIENAHGYTTCDRCGCTGDLDKFLRKEQ
jgi:transcription elongation factor Elf1